MRRLISSGSPFEAATGYSRAVVDGEWVFVAGTTGFDYAAMTIAADPIRPHDLVATIFHLLGIDHRGSFYDRSRRVKSLVRNHAPMSTGRSAAGPEVRVT